MNYLTDMLGSTIALANSSGLATQYSYEPFGATTITGSSTNPFQFTGRENDGTGLYYYRARYYSPTLGRFISQDPAGFLGGGANLYEYAGANPVMQTDPSGRGLWTGAAGAISGGIAGAAGAAMTGAGWKGILAGGITGIIAGGAVGLADPNPVWSAVIGAVSGGMSDYLSQEAAGGNFSWSEVIGAAAGGGATGALTGIEGATGAAFEIGEGQVALGEGITNAIFGPLGPALGHAVGGAGGSEHRPCPPS